MTELIEKRSVSALINDPAALDEVRAHLAKENVVIIRNVVDPGDIKRIISYLAGIGRGSLPNWQPLLPRCPNFHRINRSDRRSYVKGNFHQWSFFPWNQDLFDFYSRFRDVFVLRNILSGAEPGTYLGSDPDDDCIARLSFQFYPKGCGGMNEHRDPLGAHQEVVPILIMSELGVDFKTGGVYVRNVDDEVIWVETVAKPGDLVLFNPNMKHGVAQIDPDQAEDWLSFEGRWMSIFAVNKMATNNRVAEAIDLGAAG